MYSSVNKPVLPYCLQKKCDCLLMYLRGFDKQRVCSKLQTVKPFLSHHTQTSMTMDDKSRPTKSPARPKTAQGPAMTQKSLFSFFKPTAPKVLESQSQTEPSGSVATSASPRTPVRNEQGSGYPNGVGHASSGHRPSSVLFSTDEAVMPPSPPSTATKRKTMDFDEAPSPVKAQHETPSVKRFAAEVEKLSLNTPVKQPRFNIPDEDDLEDSLGSRRSVRKLLICGRRS